MLVVKSVKHLPMPRYPVREAALLDPDLLKRLPVRWRTCRQAAVAAGLGLSLAVSLAACDEPKTLGVPTPPPILNEEEALVKIERILQSYSNSIKENYDESSLSNPIDYVLNVFYPEDPAYKSVTRLSGDGCIDFYDPETKVGFEYLGNGDAVEKITNDDIDKPVKDHINVLVVDKFFVTTDEAEIRKQIVDFLDWLKAEGIGE